jgi:multiple sugar transport system substrate-binding protein
MYTSFKSPAWAYDGKLQDISDIIEPMKPRFSRNTVETAFLYKR